MAESMTQGKAGPQGPAQTYAKATPKNLRDRHPENLRDRHPRNLCSTLMITSTLRIPREYMSATLIITAALIITQSLIYLLFIHLLFAILSFAICVPPKPPRISICQEKNCSFVKKINDFFLVFPLSSVNFLPCPTQLPPPAHALTLL